MGIKDGTGASSTSGGYINLGSVAGLSGERDTSSCARRCSFVRYARPLTTPFPLDHQSWRY